MQDKDSPTDDSLNAWLHLNFTEGVGPITLRGLLAFFGLPESVLAANTTQIAKVAGAAVAQAITANATPQSEAREKTITASLAWLAQSSEASPRHILTWESPQYPAQLLEIADAPPVLFALGDLAALDYPILAVVGSRNATAQGIANARAFAEALAQREVCIISGLAQGIDAAAHEGAMAVLGATIAVVGTGIDRVYPAKHHDLAHRIASNGGLILSEYALGTLPMPAHFPRRNRIISGLSRAVLVVEAAAASGSLITARNAGEQGRDILAIPGSIHSPLSKGCHQLIKQGAKLVESAQDVLEELRLAIPQVGAKVKKSGKPAALPKKTGDVVLDAIPFEPIAIDALIAQLSPTMPDHAVMAQLTMLELSGQITLLPGAQVQRLG